MSKPSPVLIGVAKCDERFCDEPSVGIVGQYYYCAEHYDVVAKAASQDEAAAESYKITHNL